MGDCCRALSNRLPLRRPFRLDCAHTQQGTCISSAVHLAVDTLTTGFYLFHQVASRASSAHMASAVAGQSRASDPPHASLGSSQMALCLPLLRSRLFASMRFFGTTSKKTPQPHHFSYASLHLKVRALSSCCCFTQDDGHTLYLSHDQDWIFRVIS